MADAVSSAVSGAASGAADGTKVAPGVGTAVGAGIGAAAGIIAYLIQSGQEADAQKIIAAAQDHAGQITEDSINKAMGDVLGPSRLAQIQQDPRLQSAQNDVLSELQRVSDSGGMTVESRGQFNDAISRTAQAASQRRQSALQQMGMRGQNTSGAATQLEAAGAQSADNANASAGVQALGDAQKRALTALSERGQLAGSMQTADWQRKSDTARAQDEIDKLNWGNRQAQYANQSNLANQQLSYATQRAGAANQQGAQFATMVGNTGAAAGQAAVGVSNYMGLQPTPAQPATANSGQANGSGGTSNGTGPVWGAYDPTKNP